MPGSFATAFGAAYGRVVATGSVQPLINGLTVSNLVNVYPAKTNTQTVFLGDINVTTSTGYALEPGAQAITVDTGGSANRWYVTTNGVTATVYYASRSNEL